MRKQISVMILSVCLIPFLFSTGRAETSASDGDSAFRKAVSQQLLVQQQLARQRADALFAVLKQELNPSEREALEFLLAYAPLSDLADCTGDFFLEAVRFALKAQTEMPWGSRIPQAIFRHFVLPPRVNNENLDRFRPQMYPEIKNRIQGLTMSQAALEINHWCHEKVVYQSTDERTSAPLSTIRTAFGRCGEESTFTVAALRCAAIPARQCYTPRWAHTDDNHAWVEVWIDGEWCYMGACEPEAELNKGWFDGPVRRAMLVHSKAYGLYSGDEPVLDRQPQASTLNLLPHYARNAELTVTVLDEQNKPVAGAEVRFQLYNYAEFFTLHRQASDGNGQAAFRTGLGDLLVWASKGERYGLARLNPGQSAGARIVLDHRFGDSFSLDLDFTPPVKQDTPGTDPAQAAENARRLKQEDEIRNRYIATFIDESKTRTLAQNLGLDSSRLWDFLKRSRGNWTEIKSFLENTPPESRTLAMELLGSVSDKDLRDTPLNVLAAHLSQTVLQTPSLSRELFVPYLLNPRIANENLKPYRQAIRAALPESLVAQAGQKPELIADWIQNNIRLIDDGLNHYSVPLTPAGVLSLGCADSRSRDIFTVAVCRSIGLPARLEPGSLVPQYYKQGRWLTLRPGQKIDNPARLFLTAASGDMALKYYAQFTLGRLQDGHYASLEFPYDSAITALPSPLELPPGHYCLISGVRQKNDDILTRLHFFSLLPGQALTLPVSLREKTESFSSDIVLPAELEIELIAEAERGRLQKWIPSSGAIVAFIKAGHEPSRHLLDDLARIRPQIEAWGGSILLILKEKRDLKYLADQNLSLLPKGTYFVHIPVDQSLCLPNFEYPCCLLLAGDLSVVYASDGYRTGNDAQLLRIIAAMPGKG